MTKIITLQEIRDTFGIPRNVNTQHRESLSPLEKLAIFVTDKIGTMGFFFIIFSWTVLWLGWNIFAPVQLRFDPYPAFVMWLFISNLIQIHLMPLIMVGQNLQSRHAEMRSEHDYQTDRKSEKEIEAILLHLENQQNIMMDILKKIESLEEKSK